MTALSSFEMNQIVAFLDQICPPQLAEDWDNVGWLVGDKQRLVTGVMTCLTVTPEVVRQAAKNGVNLLVSHHPFPFRAEKRWCSDTYAGKILLELIERKIALYSPHTAHDSALWGINRQLAEIFSLQNILPLIPSPLIASEEMAVALPQKIQNALRSELGKPLGTGRFGILPREQTLSQLAQQIKTSLGVDVVPFVGDKDRKVRTIAIACGAADDLVSDAIRVKADLLLLGEVRFHRALEAREAGLMILAPGHFATECFAMKTIAERIQIQFPGLHVTTALETDPFLYCFHR